MTHRGPREPLTVSTTYGRVAFYRLRGRSIVILSGEIDVAFRRAPFGDLVAAVAAAGGPVYVDCSGVTFFGVEGLRMLDALVAAAPDHRLAHVVTNRVVDVVARVYPIDRYSLAA